MISTTPGAGQQVSRTPFSRSLNRAVLCCGIAAALGLSGCKERCDATALHNDWKMMESAIPKGATVCKQTDPKMLELDLAGTDYSTAHAVKVMLDALEPAGWNMTTSDSGEGWDAVVVQKGSDEVTISVQKSARRYRATLELNLGR